MAGGGMAGEFARRCRRLNSVALCLILIISVIRVGGVDFDYTDALAKALLFYEGQRSGKLPDSQRMLWRGDSAVYDGNVSQVREVMQGHSNLSALDWSIHQRIGTLTLRDNNK
jgi:hypothetical protein